LTRTPPGRLLIVSANLDLAFPKRPPNPAQTGAFADRIASLLPYAPDAILLQEVDRSNVSKLAAQLSERLPFTYAVKAAPNDPVVDKSSPKEDVVGDSAIIINNTTMRALERPGVISTRYRADDRAPQTKPRAKQHVYVAAGERGGSLKVAMASVHFVPAERLASTTVGFCYKGQWTQKIIRVLNGRYPTAGHLHVIAGDFNNRRCLATTETVQCETWPFWFGLVQKSGFDDAVFAVHGQSDETLREQYRKGAGYSKLRVDYIFTTATVMDASHDTTYGAIPSDPGFYSDHRLVWALIEQT
jgi:endonuclease/exonuclease/phosphatase family metal-dependent hydrolase